MMQDRIASIATACRNRLANGSATRPAPGKLRVLHAQFQRVHRCRDFQRVEAVITLVIQYNPALPPVTERLLTSVPIRARGLSGSLRERLVRDAVQLAVLMHRTDRGALPAAA
jgi:hypothetical protein